MVRTYDLDLGFEVEIMVGRHCGSRLLIPTLHREKEGSFADTIIPTRDLYRRFGSKPEPIIKCFGPCFTTFVCSLMVTGDWL